MTRVENNFKNCREAFRRNEIYFLNFQHKIISHSCGDRFLILSLKKLQALRQNVPGKVLSSI